MVEVDRRAEGAHELVVKLRRWGEWGRLSLGEAGKRTVVLVRSRLDAVERVDDEKRLWRRGYPPAARAWCLSRSWAWPP
ncbi:hypothetical protein AB0F42_23800 [Streptomyces buecherae]|uniref:hypothetical protein n=1 Tax=Streptomyces buecherae TaxID=2763006 RepID=UPI0033C7F6CF